MFNEQFAATTSEEIRKTFKMKRERGEFIGAFAPYGYKKDPNDKNSLIVDEEAAEVVKSIYHWFVLWRISGADAIDRLVSRNPIPAVYYLDRSLDRIYSACMYRWKDGCGSRS